MNVVEVPPYCFLCFATTNLSRCSRCGIAYYCSRSHQVQHWKIHKKDCRPVEKNSRNFPISNVGIENVNKNAVLSLDDMPPCHSGWPNMIQNENIAIDAIGNYKNVYRNDQIFQPQNPSSSTCTSEVTEYSDMLTTVGSNEVLQQFPMDGNNDMFSSLSSELLSSSNNYWDIFSNSDTEAFSLNFDLNIPSPKGSETLTQPHADELNFTSTSTYINIQDYNADGSSNTPQNVTLEELCQNIISDLNEFGICVLDKFLGLDLGDFICAEVQSLFRKGIFKKGELVGSGATQSENIRGDVITWVNGNEEGCFYIEMLIKKLDVLMTACNKMSNNGILGNYKLNRRTKAMIACYPGDGTHYKKHVDNPNGDGRCITCIYYLNKTWNRKLHGGVLRMFPVGHESVVANIEPIFDRMLFFWSDRRNPHEVLPSYAVRFAITVWYFDSDERDRALLKYRAQEK